MKRKEGGGFVTLVAFILALTVVVAIIPTEAEAAIYSDTVRLHIRARSDSEEDQRIKLYIRDRLLSEFSAEKMPQNKKEAEEMVSAEVEKKRGSVDAWLSEAGCDYGCNVTVTEEWFDTRDYGDFSLPCGVYTTLLIELGGGGGENWWCVMYPPLCREIAIGEISYTKEESALIYGGRYAVKFKLLELATSLAK